jgi:hypothetical protein
VFPHKAVEPTLGGDRGGLHGIDHTGRQIDSVATTPKNFCRQAPIRIDVAPMANGGKWVAAFNGETICVASSPLTRSAQILLARNFDPACTIEMWHRDAVAWALRATLGPVAAVVSDGEKNPQRHATRDGVTERAFAAHFRLTAAIDAAWRRACRSTKVVLPLAEVIGWVLEKCPDVDRTYLRREFEGRFERYRPRRRRCRKAAP